MSPYNVLDNRYNCTLSQYLIYIMLTNISNVHRLRVQLYQYQSTLYSVLISQIPLTLQKIFTSIGLDDKWCGAKGTYGRRARKHVPLQSRLTGTYTIVLLVSKIAYTIRNTPSTIVHHGWTGTCFRASRPSYYILLVDPFVHQIWLQTVLVKRFSETLLSSVKRAQP